MRTTQIPLRDSVRYPGQSRLLIPALVARGRRDALISTMRLRTFIVAQALSLIVSVLCQASAQTLPPGVQKKASTGGITEYDFPNGLRVLLYPDPASPKITVNVTYLVGSRHEGLRQKNGDGAFAGAHGFYRNHQRAPGSRMKSWLAGLHGTELHRMTAPITTKPCPPPTRT